MIEASALSLLAPLRNLSGVTVCVSDGFARVAWPVGLQAVQERLLAAPGVRFYARLDGNWFGIGHALPAFELNLGGSFVSLAQALTPQKLETELAPELQRALPVPMKLVSSDLPKPVSGALYEVSVLAAWAEMASTHVLESFTAARREHRILLVGSNPPWLTASVRLWGDRVLCPLGQRVEPALPESAIGEALGLAAGDRAIFCEGEFDLVESAAFSPLSRAALRLCLREATHGGPTP